MESLGLESIDLPEEQNINALPLNPNNTETQSDQILSQSLDSIGETAHIRNCACSLCKVSTGDELESNSFNNESTGIEDAADGQLVGQSLVPGLISPFFSAKTQQALKAAGGETLNYYIHQETGLTPFDDNSYGYSLGHTEEEAAFIHSVFESIDPLIDLDFRFSESSSGTTFDIY